MVRITQSCSPWQKVFSRGLVEPVRKMKPFLAPGSQSAASHVSSLPAKGVSHEQSLLVSVPLAHSIEPAEANLALTVSTRQAL